MKSINRLFVMAFSIASLTACGQTPTDRLLLGKDYAEQELKSALSNKNQHNVVNNTDLLIKSKAAAVAIADQITFGVYGKENIIRQRPYEAFLITNYWVISGTLPKDYVGGTFLIILDARNCNVIRLTHGK